MNALASARETAFGGGEIELRFPYSAVELREALKETVPSYFRRWDGDEKRWLVMGAYAPAAVELLLSHYPNAQVPASYVRRAPALVARAERPAVPVPLPPLDGAISPEPPRPELDHLVASVRCPKCRRRYGQPLRVVAESSATVTKREKTAPELIAICPHCHFLAVVSFFPAVAALQEASA